MKELETHLKLAPENKVELNIKKKQEVEHVLEGELKPKRGHFIWELNEETGEIKKAEYKRNTVGWNLKTELQHEELIIKSGCKYIPALNAQNAKRKYLINKEQSAYYSKPALMSLSDLSFHNPNKYKSFNY